MEELSKEQVLLVLTICDILGKSTDGKAVQDAFERSKEKWSNYLVSQSPVIPDHLEYY
jgi:hypothetical protein